MSREGGDPGTSRAPRTKRSRPKEAEASIDTAAEEALRQSDTLTLLRRLRGKPAAEILAWLSNGDPLRLQLLCARRVRETFFVLDPDRLFERALSVVAVGMELEPESCESPDWLVRRVDMAIQRLLEHDRDEERNGIPPERPEEHFGLFVTAFYVDPPLARLSSVRLNGLEERIRKGFQKLIIEGLPLDECLAMGLGPPERLQLDILHALQAIGMLDDAAVEQLRSKDGQP